MFFLKNFNIEQAHKDTDQLLVVDIDSQSKYSIEEGLCSLIETEFSIIIHWFNKVNLNKVVNTYSTDKDCIINTAHPCTILNNTEEKIEIKIKNLNNVIEAYKKSLD